MPDKIVSTVATCYKCGKKFDTTLSNAQLERLVDAFDPTDWECPACSKAEEAIESTIVEEAYNEAIKEAIKAQPFPRSDLVRKILA